MHEKPKLLIDRKMTFFECVLEKAFFGILVVLQVVTCALALLFRPKDYIQNPAKLSGSGLRRFRSRSYHKQKAWSLGWKTISEEGKQPAEETNTDLYYKLRWHWYVVKDDIKVQSFTCMSSEKVVSKTLQYRVGFTWSFENTAGCHQSEAATAW